MSRETIDYVVNIHIQNCCILGVILPAQIMMHLVYIKKKNQVTKLHIIHTWQKCQLAVMFTVLNMKFTKLFILVEKIIWLAKRCLSRALNRAIIYRQLTKVETQLSLEIPPIIIPNSRSNRYLRQFFLKICSVSAFLFPTVHMVHNPCFYPNKSYNNSWAFPELL